MSSMVIALLFGGAGLIVGWMVLPAPKFVTDFWIRQGWAKKPEAVPPAGL